MPLRSRIPARSETVQDLTLACEDRYWDGWTLLTADRDAGGVYMLGYVAEMMLKLACFRIHGARPSDLVASLLATFRAQVAPSLPGIELESFHSLRFWVEAYVLKRKALPGFDVVLCDELRRRAMRLYGNWIVDMRYVENRSLPSEVAEVYDDVDWIREVNQKGLL